MNEQDLVRLYQRGTLAQRGVDRAGCVPPESLVAVVEQQGSEDERVATLNHALACAECSEELELLRATRVVRDRNRLPHAGLALAASIVLAAGLGSYAIARHRAGTTDDADPTRGNAGDVQLVSPATSTPRLDTLVWRSVTSAASYGVEIRQDDGTLVTRGTTTDTAFVVPDSVRLTPGSVVYWTVSVRLSDGTQLRSPTRRTNLTRP